MDGKTFKESIIQSASAGRMIGMVSPIYEDSYVGCWIFEDIGREWDRLWKIIDELPEQVFPQTATWLLGLWERRYGITPNPGDTIEVRRQRIEEIEAYPKPFTPWTLDRWCQITMGRNATVTENVDLYTFGVFITARPGCKPLDIAAVRKYINQHKHSHMSYDLGFQTEERIAIKVETGYWRFYYKFCGTLPQTNYPAGIGDGAIIIGADGKAYPFDYHFTGMDEAGVLPDINVTTGSGDRAIKAKTEGSDYKISYIPCGPYTASGGIL